jgi:hypothetical protein
MKRFSSDQYMTQAHRTSGGFVVSTGILAGISSTGVSDLFL